MYTQILVRHGSTRLHERGVHVGYGNDPGLSEIGVGQITLLAQTLRLTPIPAPFKCIYTSPLPRTSQTANLLAHGLNLSVFEDSRLMDIRADGWEGRPLAEIVGSDIARAYWQD